MLDRLKSLPLTIVLTILIWMYAEAQFTSTREGVMVAVAVTSPSPDFAVRLLDEGEPHQSVPIRISVQGPQNKVDQLYQQANKQLTGDTDALTFTLPLPAANLRAGNERSFDTVSLLNNMDYFRNNGLTVTLASPARLRVDVQEVKTISTAIAFRSPTVPNVQILSFSTSEAKVSIPPRILQRIGGASHVSVVAVPIRDISALPVDTPQTVEARLTVEYPDPLHGDVVSVLPAQVSVTLKIPGQHELERTLSGVKVEAMGPLSLFDRATVEIDHPEIDVTVSGAAELVEHLTAKQIGAFLRVDDADEGLNVEQERPLRFQLPDGVRLVRSNPVTVRFRLTPRRAAGRAGEAGMFPPATTPATLPASPR